MSNTPTLTAEMESKVLALLESILDLTRASAKDWRFESRSSTEGMATLKIKHGYLNVYFDEPYTFLLKTQFPDGDYVIIQRVKGLLKGRVNETISEICDQLLYSPEYARWKDDMKADERVGTTLDKMKVSVEKAKEAALAPPPEPKIESEPDDIKLVDAKPPKKRGLLARLCGGG